jgi:hypothetical protein
VADDAGALLVRSGLVPASALDDARARVDANGGTVGEQLVAAGLLPDDVLTDFYKSRLLVPQVNPNTLARLPAKIVALIPSDMAIELRAIPVSLDKDNNLTIAMSDPSDRHAVDEIAFFTGAYVVRAVATQMQIAWCLAHYYGHVTSLGQRLLQPNAREPKSAMANAAVRVPRTRGLTGKINAARHRGIVPGEALDGARPTSEVLDEKTVPTPTPIVDSPPATEAAADAVPNAVPERRARSVSGEIRVPRQRAQSIKPVLDDFEHESGPVIVEQIVESSAPVISIEAGEPSVPVRVIEMEADAPHGDEPTDLQATPLPVPRRKRPAEPDPPELAARAGELDLKSGPIKVQLAEEPRIVVDVELERAAPPDIAASRAPTQRLDRSISVSGELSIPDAVERAVPQISVETAEDDTGSVVIREHVTRDSDPVLLERRRESDSPTNVAVPVEPIVDEPSDVVMLAPKKQQPRPERHTQVGIGAITAATRARTEPASVPSEIDDQPTGSRVAIDADPTRVDARAVPPGEYTTSDEILAAPPSPILEDNTSPIAVPPMPRAAVPPPSGKVSLDNVRPRAASIDDDDEDGPRIRPTEVMSAIDIAEVIGNVPGQKPVERRADFDPESVDDGWGPPGTTIPPPLLGAIPGSAEPKSGIIPIPNVDSAPLMVAPPSAPEVSKPELSQQGITRALEETAARVLDLIRALDTATERDQVVTVMVAHLAQTHRRAGFFAVRGGELSLFALSPPPASMPSASMRLDRPSTLQDVVGTRLPYRGPMHDDTSRGFLSAVLGGASPAEILLVPVTLRERVVGVLFGEQRMRHTFDDQIALAARAAGIALERILKAKRV